MGKTLDRSKEFGTVWGDDTGRAFSQDGLYFDGQGNEIAGDRQTIATKATSKPAAPAPTATDAQIAAQTK